MQPIADARYVCLQQSTEAYANKCRKVIRKSTRVHQELLDSLTRLCYGAAINMANFSAGSLWPCSKPPTNKLYKTEEWEALMCSLSRALQQATCTWSTEAAKAHGLPIA